MYGFPESVEDGNKVTHVMLETGRDIVGDEHPKGTIKAQLQSNGYKVFKVFKEMPLLTISPACNEHFSVDPAGTLANDTELPVQGYTAV